MRRESRREVQERRTTLIADASACFVSWMCENLYLRLARSGPVRCASGAALARAVRGGTWSTREGGEGGRRGGREKGGEGREQPDARVAYGVLALERLEDVLVVRVVHLRARGWAGCHKVSVSRVGPAEHEGQGGTHLGTAHRPDALDPEDRHLLLLLLLALSLPGLAAAPRPKRPVPRARRPRARFRRGREGEGEFLGRGGQLGEGVAEAVGLRRE